MQTHPLDLVDPDSTRVRLMSGLVATTPTSCWEWTRATDGSGYGMILVKCHSGGSRYGWRPARAHRVMWTLMFGPIPDGMVLDHICVNRTCCNPAHLQVVTQSENLRLQAERTPLRESCPKCGGSDWFTQGSQRRCRPCWRAYSRDWQRSQKPLVDCPRCGTPFRRTREHMTYCSDECSVQTYTEQDRAKSQRYRARHRAVDHP